MRKDLAELLAQPEVSPLVPLNPAAVLDKETSLKQYVSYMLDRTNSMFEYEGLPDTIPAYMLELYLQIFGYAAFIEIGETNPIHTPVLVDTKPGVYIFFGGIGGERDIYYRPKMFTAANPRLKKSIQATIIYEEDENVDSPCVLMRNDTNFVGLLPLFNRYAAQLVENDISVRSAQINARALVGISVNNDREAESARKFLDNLEAGKLSVLGESNFLQGIAAANLSTQSSNTIIQLIELQQYLKASWYNELGLNVNFNMKREYMSEEEIAVNTDILLPLVDDMLKCREAACETLSKVFGLNVTVKKSSAWANKEQEELAALSTASNEGQIPLKETIAERIEDGDFSETKQENSDIQSDVPGNSEEPGKETAENSDGERSAESGEQEGAGAEPEKSADVNINININAGGDSVESEAPEKSEESDD